MYSNGRNGGADRATASSLTEFSTAVIGSDRFADLCVAENTAAPSCSRTAAEILLEIGFRSIARQGLRQTTDLRPPPTTDGWMD